MAKNSELKCRIETEKKVKLLRKLKEANMNLSEFLELCADNPVSIIKLCSQGL